MSNRLYASWVGLALCSVAVFVLSGCASPGGSANDKILVIRWQRLVDDTGATCGRCGNTEQSLDDAQRLLTASLKPLGIRVQLIKSQLTNDQFKLAPSESNRIWIGDKTLEMILGAKSVATACAGVCGGNACRATLVNGQSYETIPAELIVRAGLRVAADLLQPAAPPLPDGSTSAAPPTATEVNLQPMPWLSQSRGCPTTLPRR